MKWIDLDVDDGPDFNGRTLATDFSIKDCRTVTLKWEIGAEYVYAGIEEELQRMAEKMRDDLLRDMMTRTQDPAIEVTDYKVVGLPQLPEPKDS